MAEVREYNTEPARVVRMARTESNQPIRSCCNSKQKAKQRANFDKTQAVRVRSQNSSLSMISSAENISSTVRQMIANSIDNLSLWNENPCYLYQRSASISKVRRPCNDLLRNIIPIVILILSASTQYGASAQSYEPTVSPRSADATPTESESSQSASSCFGGLQTFEKISMSTFENPAAGSSGSFGSGILIQQDDQALTSECVNLCRSQSNCLSFIIDYNKFECKSYATTQQELQQEFEAKYHSARSHNGSGVNATDPGGYLTSASSAYFQHLLPSSSSNYFEKICLDGVANRNQFSDVCGQGRLWTIERVVDTFLDGYVEKEVTNVNNKDECSKLCIFETQFVCRSADYDQHSRLCRLSKEDRRTQPQAMRYVAGSNRQYLENQCATHGPSSCVYETKKNVGIISMDALKFAQTVQDCQMKCNHETTFNCRSYSFNQQRCFLSGDDSSSLNTNLIKLPVKQGWLFGEKKCLVELCAKGIFTYEKITGYTLRSALSTPIDLMMPGGSSISMSMVGNNLDELEKLQQDSSQTRLRHLLPMFHSRPANTSDIVSTMMRVGAGADMSMSDPLSESATYTRHQRSANNLAITNHCRHSCDLSYLNCPAFTIDYKNNRCQRLDRNSQGRHNELVARDGFAYYEKICLRVKEIMTMCQDKYWIFERVIGFELAPRLYDKTLKFVQSRRDCEEYCLEEKQFQCRSALYNDETSECKLSRVDRRLAIQDGNYYKNFNTRISYLENQCIRDQTLDRKLQCYYEQAREDSSYPTFTEHIEMVTPPSSSSNTGAEVESKPTFQSNGTIPHRVGSAYCEELCNNNEKFECHSFGYYSSTAQCFLSGDDSISAGEMATRLSTGFTYYEKKCRLISSAMSGNSTLDDTSSRPSVTPSGSTFSTESPSLNPYFQPPRTSSPHTNNHGPTNEMSHIPTKPTIVTDGHMDQPKYGSRPATEMTQDLSSGPNQYKCGIGNTFVYQRISGFEPIGGYLTLLVRNNDSPGIVAECSELCKNAYECRAFVVDYNTNQCFAMLENSSVGLLSLRQALGKDYFEGFCVADHTLLTGSNCRNKTWIIDKIVDQAVVGVQHQKIITDSDRTRCRQACLEERLFWCKSAMYDGSTGDCKLYSIDRESMPQMRLLFTKGVDFFENQCQIVSNMCPYDAIERDMTIVTTTKSVQAQSAFDCEHACNREIAFNCRSYTYVDQYPSLPNLCLLSSDSRSTSQKGSVREHQRTLYAERNCYYRRARYPGGASQKIDSKYSQSPSSLASIDPYQSTIVPPSKHEIGTTDGYQPARIFNRGDTRGQSLEEEAPLGQACESHHYTFERTFGYDYRLAQKERAPMAPTIGIAIGCQQECIRRGDRCQSFVVEYTLPYQSCFLIETQVGANRKLLIKSPNIAYFEKICLPKAGVAFDLPMNAQLNGASALDIQSMDIAPSYSSEPWSPQLPTQIPYHIQQQQLVKNYPSRTCSKLWSFERFLNHNFTAPSDKVISNIPSKVICETLCANEASFSCRAATYDNTNSICRLFKNTRRTLMSHFIDLDAANGNSANTVQTQISLLPNSQPGTAQIISDGGESIQSSPSSVVNSIDHMNRRQRNSRQSISSSKLENSIDYFENTCTPEPASCQYRQLYDQFSLYIEKISHAVSLSDCQRQCDLERLFGCKSINYDPSSKNCMLVNEDLISLNRGQQASLLPKKNSIYSEKGTCEMISVQCNSQEMLVSINFDAPFRGRIMAKGNPEQCFMIGDGQTSAQFPIVFGPKCNSRQEGHNTFVNEVVIQQHPVIMTDSDKTVRVMCAFEAPDQTITLKNPSSHDNKTGIDVGAHDTGRTRHDKQQFNSVISNKASPPSVLLRILDQNGRDASMINLGDDLTLKIQMQTEGQNSALGIFARNLAARSSNGETLLLIDNDGCPVDHLVFPALDVDPKDGKSLFSTFKAFRFPSSGLVNFEVQIRFCPERCQPVECNKGHRVKSYGRKKRQIDGNNSLVASRTSVIQSVSSNDRSPLDVLSTVMKPGKAFQYVRELLLTSPIDSRDISSDADNSTNLQDIGTIDDVSLKLDESLTTKAGEMRTTASESDEFENQKGGTSATQILPDEFSLSQNTSGPSTSIEQHNTQRDSNENPSTSYQKSILMHVDEKIVPDTGYMTSRGLNTKAPYGRFPIEEIGFQINRHNNPMSSKQIPPQPITPIDRGESDTSSTSETSNNGSNDSSFSINTSTETPNHGIIGEDTTPSFLAAPTESIDIESDQPFSSTMSPRDVPLRFSILVGENQTPVSGEWTPSSPAPVLITNSTSLNLDHIVVPGNNGRFEIPISGNSIGQSASNADDTNNNNVNSYNDPNINLYSENRLNHNQGNETSKKNALYEQTFDAQPSNSIAAEVKIHNGQAHFENAGNLSKSKLSGSFSETAASHDCQTASGNNRLWTIIWTGTAVIVINICLVVLSLVLYFRKVHLRQNHNIVRVTSDCGTNSSGEGRRWPSVLLKSKSNLGTSLNTHEHFFCKLNSKPNGHDFNWPNLSSSSSHSTISSMASPLPMPNVRLDQSRHEHLNFDHQSTTRNKFTTSHRSIYDVNSFDNLRASYTNNIDESHPGEINSLQ